MKRSHPFASILAFSTLCSVLTCATKPPTAFAAEKTTEKAQRITRFMKEQAEFLGASTTTNGTCPFDKSEMNQMQLALDYPSEFPDRQNNVAKELTSSYWTCIYLRQNLERDRHTLLPEVKDAFLGTQKRTVKVEGMLKYAGVIPMPYRYELKYHANGSIEVVVRIHYWPSKRLAKEPDLKDTLARVRTTVAEAEELWNSSAPKNVRYRFDVMDSKEKAHFSAHFSVKLNYHLVAALYNRNIPPISDPIFFAHEIGHMMGLDDEYSYAGGLLPLGPAGVVDRVFHRDRRNRGVDISKQLDARCWRNSLMCSGIAEGDPYPYHHYLILRRGVSR